jgi:hypothetical protein
MIKCGSDLFLRQMALAEDETLAVMRSLPNKAFQPTPRTAVSVPVALIMRTDASWGSEEAAAFGMQRPFWYEGVVRVSITRMPQGRTFLIVLIRVKQQ